jgi:hypothetical protein
MEIPFNLIDLERFRNLTDLLANHDPATVGIDITVWEDTRPETAGHYVHIEMRGKLPAEDIQKVMRLRDDAVQKGK